MVINIYLVSLDYVTEVGALVWIFAEEIEMGNSILDKYLLMIEYVAEM